MNCGCDSNLSLADADGRKALKAHYESNTNLNFVDKIVANPGGSAVTFGLGALATFVVTKLINKR